MERQIVDIEYEDGSQHIGQICRELGNYFSVSLLGYAGDGLWDFDGDHDIVPRESVSGFYDTTNLETTGLYEKNINGMYAEKNDSDDDFEYELDSSDEEPDSESDISLCDEEFL